jgi:hypothetical protein
MRILIFLEFGVVQGTVFYTLLSIRPTICGVPNLHLPLPPPPAAFLFFSLSREPSTTDAPSGLLRSTERARFPILILQ